MQELQEISAGIVYDGRLDDAEFLALTEWMQANRAYAEVVMGARRGDQHLLERFVVVVFREVLLVRIQTHRGEAAVLGVEDDHVQVSRQVG